jgi:hypothetical protein
MKFIRLFLLLARISELESINREHIGKTSGDLVTLWNDANPADLIAN